MPPAKTHIFLGYCWWKKSQTTSCDGAKTVQIRGFQLPTSTGELMPDFWLPSTVSPHTILAKFHQPRFPFSILPLRASEPEIGKLRESIGTLRRQLIDRPQNGQVSWHLLWAPLSLPQIFDLLDRSNLKKGVFENT